MTLQEAAKAVLLTPDAVAKAQAAQQLAVLWRDGKLEVGAPANPPQRPQRPPRPALGLPREVPRRRVGAGVVGRVALLHAIAHIELNAVDLAADLLARFGTTKLPKDFFDDWVRVLDEEGKHFLLVQVRLQGLGAGYGDLTAHDGLWQAAEITADDFLARLAIVPLVLEARGLDVTPAMIMRLEAVKDQPSAEVLRVIYFDEIGHVAAGQRWFNWEAARRGLEPRQAWRNLVKERFKGFLKPPFNDEARARAGMLASDYQALIS